MSAPATPNHRASSPHVQSPTPSGPGASAFPARHPHQHPSSTSGSAPLPRPSLSEPGTPPPLAAPQSLPLNDDGSFTYRPYNPIGHTLKAPAHAHLLAPLSHHPRAAALAGQLPALGKRPLPFLGPPLTSPTQSPAASRSNSLTAAALPGSLPSLPYGTARPLLRPGSDSGLGAGGGGLGSIGGAGGASVVPPVRSRFAQQHQQQLLHQNSAGRISPVSPAAAASASGGIGGRVPPPWADAPAPVQPHPHAPASLPPMPPASSQPHQQDATNATALAGQASGSVWGAQGSGAAVGPERRGSRSFKAGSGGGGGGHQSALERAASRSQATLERVSSGLERPRSNSGLGGMAPPPPQSQPSKQQPSQQQHQQQQGAKRDAGGGAGTGVPGGQAAEAGERPFTPAMARREAARANESLLSNLLGGGRPDIDFGSVKVRLAVGSWRLGMPCERGARGQQRSKSPSAWGSAKKPSCTATILPLRSYATVAYTSNHHALAVLSAAAARTPPTHCLTGSVLPESLAHPSYPP